MSSTEAAAEGANAVSSVPRAKRAQQEQRAAIPASVRREEEQGEEKDA